MATVLLSGYVPNPAGTTTVEVVASVVSSVAEAAPDNNTASISLPIDDLGDLIFGDDFAQ